MICELCGRQVNDAVKIELEGTVITACERCKSAGKQIKKVRTPSKAKKHPKPAKKPKFDVADEYDLVDDYEVRIRKSREGKGWTQADLGSKVNEPESLIHRIELGKYVPNNSLSKKLEKKLQVKILVPHRDLEEPTHSAGDGSDVTIGDMVVIRKRDR